MWDEAWKWVNSWFPFDVVLWGECFWKLFEQNTWKVECVLSYKSICLESKPTEVKKLKDDINVVCDRFEPLQSGAVIFYQNWLSNFKWYFDAERTKLFCVQNRVSGQNLLKFIRAANIWNTLCQNSLKVGVRNWRWFW